LPRWRTRECGERGEGGRGSRFARRKAQNPSISLPSYAFPPSDYDDPGAPPGAGAAANLMSRVDFDDVVADVASGVGAAAGRAAGALGGGAVAAVDAARRAPGALLGAVGRRGPPSSGAASDGGWSDRALL